MIEALQPHQLEELYRKMTLQSAILFYKRQPSYQNKYTMNNNFNELDMPNEQKQPEKTPNESGGFHVEGHIKIFDPETGEWQAFVEELLDDEPYSEELIRLVSEKMFGKKMA
jgi:hypothetical protein